jgi:hypothetical protein
MTPYARVEEKRLCSGPMPRVCRGLLGLAGLFGSCTLEQVVSFPLVLDTSRRVPQKFFDGSLAQSRWS